MVPKAPSDLMFPVGVNHSVHPDRSGLKRRVGPVVPLTLNQENRSAATTTSSPTSRANSLPVRRCLLGVSQLENSENLYRFVIDEACDQFIKNYDFNPRECCPVSTDSGKFKWERVDENTWHASSIAHIRRVVRPLLPVRLGKSSNSVSSSRPVNVNNNKDTEITLEERRKETRERLSFPAEVEKPASLHSKKVRSTDRLILRPRQTSIHDYMSPRKRKSQTCAKASCLDLTKPKGAAMVKRAKIDYFNSPAACKTLH